MLIRGNDLHVVDEGSGGPPLLLVHGFTGADLDWVDVQSSLATRRRVISYTHRGHGDSAHADGYSLAELVLDLDAVIDELDLAPLHLVGHSMGGVVAMQFALTHRDRLASLILMDTFAAPLSNSSIEFMLNAVGEKALSEGMDPVFELMRPFMTGVRPEVLQRVEYKIRHMDPKAFMEFGRSLSAFPSMLERLDELADIPVTVLVGANDTALVEPAEGMHKAIPGSHFEVITGAAHSPQEEQPQEWLRVVENHLARGRVKARRSSARDQWRPHAMFAYGCAMAEKDMIRAVQAALDDAGVGDTIRDVGQFMPRGTTGSLFAGGMIGDEIGGSLGGAVGAIGGIEAASASHGLPKEMLVGASDSTVYGFKMAPGGRRKEPHELVFRVQRQGLDVKVHSRVNVRILELVDTQTGSKIELEGNRLPITHSHDLIKFLAGDKVIAEADAAGE